jgi:type 1 glutamine amidotransferase
MRCLGILTAALFVLSAADGFAADAPKRLLLVTHSAGFIHDSVGVAEEVLKGIGPKHGFAVTCYRFTNDPDAIIKVKRKGADGKEEEVQTTALADYSRKFRERTGVAVEKENCGRINAGTLKNFDCVLFFTTGNPLNKDELKDLMNWVRDGGAFAGTHCGSDTLYNTPYGELVGGYFDGHPWHQKIRLKLEDPAHPAAKGFPNGSEITDEIYQFREPYSRDRLHIILSVDNSSIDINKNGVKRADKDFAVAWCQQFGKGRSFYTSLGHRKEVWKDPRFQDHLIGGLKWALGQAQGDATPSAMLKKIGAD